ncbi:MAG: hypothetical protein GVY09_06620 [Gammaproteobacteria bacterium]|jgi:hypothetical protein|nr:hypothetical protein [Gammaproteobacteria bacterium]
MRTDPATDELTLDWPAAPGYARPEYRRAPAPGNAERTRVEATAQPAAPEAEAALAETGLPLSALLRGLGAAVVIGAFVLYLFQGWRGGDDLTRALLLLGHTVALTAAGFGLGHWLREPRGARLFIALALAAMPVSFAFLGGLLYGHIGGAQPDPAAAGFWQSSPGGALGLGPVLLLTLAATTVLTLAIGIGFLVLARRSARALTALYALGNLTLLVPVREGPAVPALLLGLGALLGAGAVQLRRNDASLATADGRFARLALALPVLLIAGRSLWLYAPDALFFAVLALLGYGVLRQAIDAGARWPQLLETAAAAMACAAAGSVLLVLAPLTGVADAAKLPLAALVLAGLLLDLGNRPIHARPAHRSAAAALIASVMALNLLAHGGLGPAAGTVAAGVGALAAGYGLRRRTLFLLGIAVALLGLGYAGEAMLARFTLGTWTLLVLLGSASIVAGSVVERHGAALQALLARGRQHFKAAA